MKKMNKMDEKTSETSNVKLETSSCSIPIIGMHCASCATIIEGNLSKVDGVSSARVNFASGKASVDFDSSKTSRADFEKAIVDSGYKVVSSSDERNDRLLEWKVIGMDNPHCVSAVDGALKLLKGLKSVDLKMNGHATISYDPSKTSSGAIKKAIESAGYSVVESSSVSAEESARRAETSRLRNLFFLGLVLSIPIMILSFGFSVPYQSWILLVLSSPVQIFLGWGYYRGSWIALKNKNATMDTLIALGTTAAFAYSVAAIFFPSIGAELYFDTSAVILTFITLGKWLELRAKGKASDAIKKLMELAPLQARIVVGDEEKMVPV